MQVTQYMWRNTGDPLHVPQHLLLMATVLRYIMRQTDLLRKPELDSFLITAFSPELMDADYLARSKLDLITPRGVQLATLFMEGVEKVSSSRPMPRHRCKVPFIWVHDSRVSPSRCMLRGNSVEKFNVPSFSIVCARDTRSCV